MSNIARNFEQVNRNIRCAAGRAGRDPSCVTLIAVTKTIASESINEAILAGAKILGENRVQEAKKKIENIEHEVEWHLIGRLQTNKIKYIFDLFDLIHSVDSLALAKEIDKRARQIEKRIDILIQVNVSGEKSKSGIPKKGVIELIKNMSKLTHISINGLMTIPPLSENSEDSRNFFKELVFIKKNVEREDIKNISMRELSMGMSNDYEIAVEEGATMVRVGSAIFGERQYVRK